MPCQRAACIDRRRVRVRPQGGVISLTRYQVSTIFDTEVLRGASRFGPTGPMCEQFTEHGVIEYETDGFTFTEDADEAVRVHYVVRANTPEGVVWFFQALGLPPDHPSWHEIGQQLAHQRRKHDTI